MLDQADYAGIDDYIKRHGLHDASLAAGRRAKIYGVNDPKQPKDGSAINGAAPANGGADTVMEDGDEEETELQKAERMLQDEEDELEEDYVDDDGDEGSSEDEDYGEDTIVGDGDGDAEGFDEEEEFDEEAGGYEDDEE